MGVGGARDTAIDVTYSTKTDGGMGLGFGTRQNILQLPQQKQLNMGLKLMEKDY